VPDLDAGGAVGTGHEGLLEDQESAHGCRASGATTPSSIAMGCAVGCDSTGHSGLQRTQRDTTAVKHRWPESGGKSCTTAISTLSAKRRGRDSNPRSA
jgi:hypothetical protein